MNWKQVWHCLGVSGIVALAVLVACAISGDHSVKAYYLGRGGTCVYAQVEWEEDPVIFCSQDAGSALDVLVKANASLKK